MPVSPAKTAEKQIEKHRSPGLRAGLRQGFAALRREGAVAPLCWLAAGGILLGLLRFVCAATSRADWFSAHVSAPVRQVAAAVADAVPFSVAEVLCTLFVLSVLAFSANTIWRLLKHRPVRLLRRAAILAAVLVFVAAGAQALWSVEYYATSFAEKIGLSASPVSSEQLRAVTEYFAAKVNETADDVPRQNGLFSASQEEIFAASGEIYQTLETEYPCLQAPVHRPKPAMYSYWMSLSGFTGYLFAFTGESTLNVACPAVFLPATVAHEFSHQRGVAAEQEANFCAVRAGVTSGNTIYEYSAWLFGYLHLSNALYRADPAACYAVNESLCAKAQWDLDENNAYWNRYDGTVKSLAQGQYGSFLQNNGQTLGMESYGACVDLLVACYLPQCS